jgi:hypothetical protein
MPSSWAYDHTLESLLDQNYLLLTIASILQSISVITTGNTLCGSVHTQRSTQTTDELPVQLSYSHVMYDEIGLFKLS